VDLLKFNKICNADDWQDEQFSSDITTLNLDIKDIHRKWWEYARIYRAVNTFVKPYSHGLGLAVGHECLIYKFSHEHNIIATDLYSGDTSWEEARLSIKDVYNRGAYRKGFLTVINMDMRRLDFEDERFHFVWSSCSIEHLDSFEEIKNCLKDIHRVLMPDGLLILTTEWHIGMTLVRQPCNQMFYFDSLPIFEECGFNFVERDIAENIQREMEVMRNNPNNEPDSVHDHSRPHVIVRHKGLNSDFTSVCFVLRKR
jgi:SAM-dependent methyltransferase